jgi:membrane carboxypeptidase/penicillin-binding protein PbpC
LVAAAALLRSTLSGIGVHAARLDHSEHVSLRVTVSQTVRGSAVADASNSFHGGGLQFRWWVDGEPLAAATSRVRIEALEDGPHEVVVEVDDGAIRARRRRLFDVR